MATDIGVIFDLETTDNDIHTADVVQLGAVTIDDHFNVNTVFQTYARPDRECTAGAFKTHGIGPDKYWLSPHQTVVLSQFKCYLDYLQEQGHRVFLAGYNSERFDAKIIDRILPSAGFMDYPQLDPSCLGPRLFPYSHQVKNHKLATMHRFLYPDEKSEAFRESAHDAVADVWMVAQILMWMMREYRMPLSAVQEWCSSPMVTNVCWFGKHRDVEWKFVPRNYLYMMRNKFDDMSIDQDAILTSLGVR